MRHDVDLAIAVIRDGQAVGVRRGTTEILIQVAVLTRRSGVRVGVAGVQVRLVHREAGLHIEARGQRRAVVTVGQIADVGALADIVLAGTRVDRGGKIVTDVHRDLPAPTIGAHALG